MFSISLFGCAGPSGRHNVHRGGRSGGRPVRPMPHRQNRWHRLRYFLPRRSIRHPAASRIRTKGCLLGIQRSACWLPHSSLRQFRAEFLRPGVRRTRLFGQLQRGRATGGEAAALGKTNQRLRYHPYGRNEHLGSADNSARRHPALGETNP